MVHGFNDGKNKIDIIDLVYPVGSIYMSVNPTDPSTIFGGTWEVWGAGRVPVGVDSEQTEFDTVEETGGEKTHTLSSEEIPSHTHDIADYGNLGINGYRAFKDRSLSLNEGSGSPYSFTSVGDSALMKNFSTTSAGSGNAHNNLQPYITCYMWKRTE